MTQSVLRLRDKSASPKLGSLRRAFATMVSASAAPYGYTLTVWSAGALLIHFRGSPKVWEVFLFLTGAVVAFAALWLLGRGAIEDAHSVSEQSARALAGALDLFAVGLAVGVAALMSMIPSWAAWPVTSMGVAAIYMVAGSLQLAVAEGQEDVDSDGARHSSY
jgi:uncharacterized membrane protein